MNKCIEIYLVCVFSTGQLSPKYNSHFARNILIHKPHQSTSCHHESLILMVCWQLRAPVDQVIYWISICWCPWHLSSELNFLSTLARINYAYVNFRFSYCEQLISYYLVPVFRSLSYMSSTFLFFFSSCRAGQVVHAGWGLAWRVRIRLALIKWYDL